MLIRPVTTNDLDAVLRIADAAGIGMTSLPPDRDVLERKVERAVASFEETLDDPSDALYFFVLEDPDLQEIVGTCAIEAYVGLKRPMYSYKLVTVTQYSETLDSFARNDMLQMVNDYTGVSEIGSLFLLPEYRRDRLGRFLSRMRFVFMALFQERFAERVIAEIRGWHDGKGNSPFYNSLAKKFFQIEFTNADWICATQGNRFISELMPTYPIYVSLLPKHAQDVIGLPYVNSEPAKAMLEREGFYYNNYIDIFDGGPTLEAKIQEIRGVKQTNQAIIKDIVPTAESMSRVILATTAFSAFKSCLGYIDAKDGQAVIDKASATLLGLDIGDSFAYSSL